MSSRADRHYGEPGSGTCMGKTIYLSKAAAKQALKNVTGKGVNPVRLKWFRCPVCNQWHLGHHVGNASNAELRAIRLRKNGKEDTGMFNRAEFDRQLGVLDRLCNKIERKPSCDPDLYTLSQTIRTLAKEMDLRLSQIEAVRRPQGA